MQKIVGYMRRAIEDYNLIKDGDRIAVGVSGGKDSMALLQGLCMLKRFIGIDYEVVAVTLDPQFGGVPGDYSEIEKMCEELNVQYVLKRTDIGSIVFDIRKETNPCSLCAKMRRGILHDATKEAGCNKIALGHNFDDAVETFIMNLFKGGRIGCYAPISYLSRKDIHMIRPLSYAPENEILNAVRRSNIPIVKSICPADKITNRQKTKEFLSEMERNDKGFKERIFGAMKKANVDGWSPTINN